MKTKIITATLLIVCGAGIGWLAYENLMWGVWGKQNSWFEYVGFLGCPLMIGSGFIVIKDLKIGSILGLIAFVLMLFYLGPAIVNTAHAIAVGRLILDEQKTLLLIFIVAFPLLTLGRLAMNISRV